MVVSMVVWFFIKTTNRSDQRNVQHILNWRKFWQERTDGQFRCKTYSNFLTLAKWLLDWILIWGLCQGRFRKHRKSPPWRKLEWASLWSFVKISELQVLSLSALIMLRRSNSICPWVFPPAADRSRQQTTWLAPSRIPGKANFSQRTGKQGRQPLNIGNKQ